MTDLATLSETDALELTERIRTNLTAAWDLLVKAYRGRIWMPLGYESWDAYTDAEFRQARLRIPREERRELVASLSEQGLSTRTIGSALGINDRTVRRDQAGAANAAPTPPLAGDEPIPDGQMTFSDVPPEPPPAPRSLGQDGKSYPATRPKPPEPSPAVTDWLADSQAVKDSGYLRAFTRDLARAAEFITYDAERLAQLLDPDDMDIVEMHAAGVARFMDKLRRNRAGLRVIRGEVQS